jgi:trimethylamine--corrinoid protein Co-methyltransferase
MNERMSLLSDTDVNKLHTASMEILRDVGIAFHEPEAVEIFKHHGVKVDGNVVFIEEHHVEAALKSAPYQFQLNARNPEKDVIIGGENLVIAPGYGSIFMVTDDGDQRKGVMRDYDNFCKLVHTSTTIDMNGCLMIDPSDRDAQFAHLDMIFSNIVLCDKPFLGSSVSRQAAIDSIHMAQIAWGGQDKIQNKPVMMAIISSFSPLQYSAEMAGTLIEFARHGQANMIGLLMQAGATGPITLPGLLALQNAEMLAGVTLAQLVNPGAPVVYGSTSTITDMRSGALSIGAPELSMIQKATIQMAKFYGLPSRGSGGLSDSHFPDIQAGVESTLALTLTILSGANFVLHACGILGSYLGMSYEKFLVDEEICGMLRRMLRPLDVTDERIDLDSIKSVGIGGEYLTHPKTVEHCRSEFYLPGIMSRDDYATWKDAGRKRLDETGTGKFAERIGKYKKPDMDPAIERDLSQFVKSGYTN